MLVPNRHAANENYRYGFQGQEKDDELKGGEGNSLNYTFRMHNPRVGRFFTTDPLEDRYPYLTPYQFSSNSPIGTGEIEGLEGGEEVRFNQWMRSKGGVQAQSVATEQEMHTKIGEILFMKMPEATIDGLTYTTTSLFQGLVGGFSYGYGDIMYNNGYKTKVDIPSYKFDFKNGFSVDTKFATKGNLSFKDGMRIIDGVGTMFAIGELNSIKSSLKPMLRENLSSSFYKKAGFEIENIPSHLKGIDFEKSVFTKTYKKGTVLEQWTYLDRITGNPKIGNYFTLPGSDPKKLGIPLEGRVKTSLELLEDTKFLQSTTKEIEDWTQSGRILKGGGT